MNNNVCHGVNFDFWNGLGLQVDYMYKSGCIHTYKWSSKEEALNFAKYIVSLFEVDESKIE